MFVNELLVALFPPGLPAVPSIQDSKSGPIVLYFKYEKSKSAVTNIIYGKPVLNRNVLSNQQVLNYFEKVLPELQK
jgi:exo-beta-1,3-glucanase (GH17 family)